MAIPEVAEAFDKHIESIPIRFIDLEASGPSSIKLVERVNIKRMHAGTIGSITEADIQQHTSYAYQHRGDVIRTIVRSIVKYAVLSHAWREVGEFTYQDLISSPSQRVGPGWDKLTRFVELARERFKCRFAWADTVCVDPSTPSDRQAAARSCFYWFRNAYICIVYLANTRFLSELGRDTWFRRGWPLLELLAPIRIKFYGVGWEPLNVECRGAENDKADGNFLYELSRASGISIDDLRSFLPGPNRVREKLSWASRRKTTALEDRAYSLISIFVSPIEVYPGEGERAFLKLMRDIIPRSRECDAFAWAGQSAQDHPVIPSSPDCYGKQYRDRDFNSDPHHYRLRGDRSFSLAFDHLTIKVIIIDVVREDGENTGFTTSQALPGVSLNRVKLLSGVLEDAQMAIAVIDYDWADNPDKGELRAEECYFGFLLQRKSEHSRWEKMDTDKVIFLENREFNMYDLQVLHLTC